MDKSLFEFEDYKAFLHAKIASSPREGKGLRRKLAESMGCQVAYVSHVLAADRHFSLEQAEAAARFFNLRSEETEFFLLLVEWNRAGTENLKKVLARQLDRRRSEHQLLKSRVAIQGKISEEDQAQYYSSWHYEAIHILLTIPEFRTIPKIARRLKIHPERASEILSFFLEKGIARETADGYTPTDAHIYLKGDSPLISKYHSGWRVHVLQSLDLIRKEDLHYSAAVTLSAVDYQKVRELLSKTILESHKIIRPSKEEKFCVMALDFYEA